MGVLLEPYGIPYRIPMGCVWESYGISIGFLGDSRWSLETCHMFVFEKHCWQSLWIEEQCSYHQ